MCSPFILLGISELVSASMSISPSPHRIYPHLDYFNFKRSRQNSNTSAWTRDSLSPAMAPLAPAMSSPSSSRGSWSSLFNATSMRRFINGKWGSFQYIMTNLRCISQRPVLACLSPADTRRPLLVLPWLANSGETHQTVPSCLIPRLSLGMTQP